MVFRVREKGVLLTQAVPYFSKYHMPSRHFGAGPISVRLCSTGDLAPPADSKLHLCSEHVQNRAVSQADTFGPDDPGYTWHEDRISNVQPSSLCFQAPRRQEQFTLPRVRIVPKTDLSLAQKSKHF